MRLGGQPLDLIGVLDPEFELLYPPGINVERVPDVWTPLAVDFASGSRINVFLRVIGRLKDGVTIEQAQLSIGLGLLFAWGGVRVLLALGPENLPRLGDVAVDPMVVTFAALAGCVSIMVFRLIPAIRASRPDVMDLLRRAGRTGGLASGNWLRSAVVTAEVALSFVLLVGCGLMIRSFVALQRAEPGYDESHVLTFSTPNLRLPDAAARQAFMRNMRDRLKGIPGVVDATAATPLPLDGRDANARWGTEEALSDPAKFQQATVHIVLPGYFAAIPRCASAPRRSASAWRSARGTRVSSA